MTIRPKYIVQRGYTNYTMKVYKLYTPNNAHFTYLAYEKMGQNDCKKCYKKLHKIRHFKHIHIKGFVRLISWGRSLQITPNYRENRYNTATLPTTPKSRLRGEDFREVKALG